MTIWVKPGKEQSYPAEIDKYKQDDDAKVAKDQQKYNYPSKPPKEPTGIKKLFGKGKNK